MNPDRQYHSQLFTIRLWIEPSARHLSSGTAKFRFKVQHVLSGEVRYFREWSALIEFLVSVAQADEGSPSDPHLPGLAEP